MSFQIHSLPHDDYAPLFVLSDEDLESQGAKRMTVNACPGTPCRISMQDARIGESVILLNYQHQPEASPYQASHAIFVREGARPAELAPGDVPEVIRSRLISVRLFDEDHMMVDADVVDGIDVAQAIETAFKDPGIRYIHLHNAKPGCFAAKVTRA
ncbi:MAG: DUF1203 domain-containing protein [Pseudomonadota bacterium]